MLTVYSILNMLHCSCNNYPEKVKNYLFEYNSYVPLCHIPIVDHQEDPCVIFPRLKKSDSLKATIVIYIGKEKRRAPGQSSELTLKIIAIIADKHKEILITNHFFRVSPTNYTPFNLNLLRSAQNPNSLFFQEDERHQQHEDADRHILQISEDCWPNKANSLTEDTVKVQE